MNRLKERLLQQFQSIYPDTSGVNASENRTNIILIEDVPKRYIYRFFLFFSLLMILFAFVFNTPREILAGSIVLLTSPSNLLTDYFQLANVGATLVNVSCMTLVSIGIIRISNSGFTGPIIAALFTMVGFSFFGKNIFNSLPIMLGVYGYSKAVRLPFGKFTIQCLFSTALSPLVSEISFNIGIPLIPSLILGIASGLFVGFIITPLSTHFLKFHNGYSLYNIGFTAGIIGMVFMAVLNSFGIKINTVSIFSSGNNLEFSTFLYGLFTVFLLCGLALNHWNIKGFRQLVALSGELGTDFFTFVGVGVTLMNMALLGMISTTYVLIVGGDLNGPVIGGIFTVVGFGAYGKHIKNVIPILAGVYIANLFNVHTSNSSFAIVAALFGTTLAPIAGHYGIIAGLLAGILHMSLVSNIGFLHAGMNLYNNGFSGGFIAAILCPLLNAIKQIKQSWLSK